jgi:MoxR-like ATPase
MSDNSPSADLSTTTSTSPEPWWVFTGSGQPRANFDLARELPDPPPWRRFPGSVLQPPPPPEDSDAHRRLGTSAAAIAPSDNHEIDMINAALLLRRPLLVTGAPGTGKSTLAYRVARELGLGRVLQWRITTHSTLKSGLYDYDAIGRVQAIAAKDAVYGIGNFIRLGPLGTALLSYQLPRVLLIDELDKSDIDLPNNLLHVFEDGEFDIPELVRLRERDKEIRVVTDDPDRTAVVVDGRVRCQAFPFVVITSNGEREFPPAFLRRCLRVEMTPLREGQLAAIVAAHFNGNGQHTELVRAFFERTRDLDVAVDQLLNAVYLRSAGVVEDESWPLLRDALWRELSSGS